MADMDNFRAFDAVTIGYAVRFLPVACGQNSRAL
jgi:hypothetical protein